MTSLPTTTVAVIGATGHLGGFIMAAFLSAEFFTRFRQVKVLARRQTEKTAQLERDGATVEIYDENDLARSLQGVDVLVNTIGSSGGAMRDRLLPVLVKSQVKLYFPSEFGVNHTTHDFSHPEWDKKQRHMQLLADEQQQQRQQNLRACRVFNGLFLEDSIGPWFGFDTKRGVYRVAGSKDARISFTSLEDVGKVVATLAAMSPDAVPPQIQIAGDTVSVAEIAQIMSAAGAGDIRIEELNGPEYKTKVLNGPSGSPAKHLRFLMGDGSINYSSSGGRGNQNELVNPEGQKWAWKTMKDLAQKTNGRPWADFDGPEEEDSK